jgi:hypothetical protein
MKNQRAPTSDELIAIIVPFAQKAWVGVCARNRSHAFANPDYTVSRSQQLCVSAEDVTVAGNWAKNWWIDVFRHQLARDALQLGAALSLALSMDVRFGAVSRKDIFFDVWPASDGSVAAATLVAKGEPHLAMGVLIEHSIAKYWGKIDEAALALDPDPAFLVILAVRGVVETVRSAGFKQCSYEDVYLHWLVKRILSSQVRK